MPSKWTDREYRTFEEWQERFDRPYWWMLAAVVGVPVCAFVLGAMK